MDIPMELTLEQRFTMKLYKGQVGDLSKEDSQEFLLEVLRQLMVKDNMVKFLLKERLAQSAYKEYDNENP